jgi:hypothetical protein
VPCHLHELVLIDMSLEWSQIDILSPTLIYVENLYLVRNNCRKICSEFTISKDLFKNLRYLNLEQNGIESWDELVGFRVLPNFKHLVVTKNKIPTIYHRPGFRGLKTLMFDDNLINDWKTFDQLNEFESLITDIRCSGNPIMEEIDKEVKRNKQIVVSRIQSLVKYNGMKIEQHERRDFEIFYLKIAYEGYARMGFKVDSIDDEAMAIYMNEHHPRFFELVHKYGSPLDMVNLKKEGKNIAQTAASLTLISEVPGKEKTLKKKLLLSMSVSDLKAMLSKVFKIEVLNQKLSYWGPEDTHEYPLDEDFRQLSFYSIADDGKLYLRE